MVIDLSIVRFRADQTVCRFCRIALWLAVLTAALQAAPSEKSITARSIRAALKVDGQLDEDAWASAEPVSDFVQSEPHEGGAPSERTVVRILFDKDNLYFGVYCYDSEPQKIVVSDLKRDFQARENDTFSIALDTFHDHRNSFIFFTNANAAQRDEQGLNDGREINPEWEGVWYAASAIQRDGWSSEIVIPFKTIGLVSKETPTLGVNFERRIRRKNEVLDWSPIPRRFSVGRVSLAGMLLGLEEFQVGHNLRVKPFVTANFTQARLGESQRSTTKGDGGVDLKYNLTQGLALDVTYNTDFSQVEVDTEQINLTRFSLFFPERRDFFLENAGIFHFGDVTRERGPRLNEASQLFYSRRIGLSPAGRPLSILGGARLSGRIGPTAVGFLNMQQEESDGFPSNNFTVARVSHNILRQSDVGAIFVNRRGGSGGDYNRAYGVDANFQLSQEFTLNSYMAATQTPGRQGNNFQGKISGRWDDGFWQLYMLYTEIGENFKPEVGFVPRTGVRNYQLNFGFRPRPAGNRYIREYYPHMNAKIFRDRHNRLLTKDTHVGFQLFFRDGGSIELQLDPMFERLDAPFEIRKNVVIPPGDYPFNDWSLEYSSDRSRLFSATLNLSRGDFYDGTKKSVVFSGRLLVKPHWATSFDYQANRVDLKAGSFDADLYGLRFNYSFNPKMFLDAFIQYNTTTGRILTNLRFNLEHHPLSNLSLVLTEDRAAGLSPDFSRAFIVKYTHLLQF